MAQTAISTQKPFGPYGTPGSGALDLTWTEADTVNGNSFAMTGGEILLIWNTDTATHTVTISSVADSLGRTGDVSAYSLSAGDIAAYSFRGGQNGWQQTDGTLHFEADSDTVKFAIITPVP